MNVENKNPYSRDLPSYIGHNLHILRAERHLSLKQLGDMVGVSASYLARIEHNERKRVSYSILNNLAHALDVEMETLLNEPNSEPTQTTRNQKQLFFSQIQSIFKSTQLTEEEKLEYLKAVSKISELLLVNY